MGRNTYDDSEGFGGTGPHPTAAVFVVSHRPAPPGATDKQTFVTSPAHIALSLAEAVPAPGVTHLRYRIETGRAVPEPDVEERE